MVKPVRTGVRGRSVNTHITFEMRKDSRSVWGYTESSRFEVSLESLQYTVRPCYEKNKGWGYSSVVEHLSRRVGSILCTANRTTTIMELGGRLEHTQFGP